MSLLVKLDEGDVLESFQAMDKNGDGLVDASEIRDYYAEKLGENGLSENDVHQMLSMADLDGDRALAFDEFKRIVQIAKSPPDPETASELRKTFAFFDANGDGSLSLQEFIDAIVELEYDIDDPEEMFNEADVDKNGKINFTEFVELMIDEDDE
eukprot:TRINITY_DN3527_c0_g3_i1.p1 TRINITY_DN3527_c0_g3~~TRINITY_DN3527_c0_g3_i1.p1  ORF type:complete len:154 (-),score=42.36 TRINITY_DN3527_c0_g3_i1:114-575(-)